MSSICKYCKEPENKQVRPGLICKSCTCFVHIGCLRSLGTPGDFPCDVYFDFTCAECTSDKKEKFARNKFPWVNVIYLVLHHLNSNAYGISNRGFFHYKMHICSFIDRSCHALLGPTFKQKKNWMGTVAGTLSVYSNLFFKSGSTTLGEQGWWKLQHAFSPAVAAHILQEMAGGKPKCRLRSQMSLDQSLFIEKVTEMGYSDLLYDDSQCVAPPAIIEPAPAPEPEPQAVARKKRRFDSDNLGTAGASHYHPAHTDVGRDNKEESSPEEAHMRVLGRSSGYSDAETAFRGFEYTPAGHVAPSDTSSVHSLQQSMLYYDSDSPSRSPRHAPDTQYEDYEEKPQIDTKKLPVPTEAKPKKAEEKPIIKTESLFSTLPNSIDMPWLEKSDVTEEPKKDLVPMTPYEELQLLKQIENLISKVKDASKKAELYRMRAKLALRRLKRHRHMPLFDFDKTVKLLGGYVTDDPAVATNGERVLDRFRRSHLMDSLCGTISTFSRGSLLVPRVEPAPCRSPYSGLYFKPYIRRDAETVTLWMRLMDELLRKTNRLTAGYEPPPRATIDYEYVRPQHVPAVNNLCARYFWPGIDLTEALQYPEYSCVVTYRRVAIACAFLVPDAGLHEAYISFVLVRPEWRNAGIASFMLYHLLQTCTGKDVTLHVSPTNPAIFLYQKFGFKVEELMQDFYEKYYDVDYKGTRHALFLRLVR